MRRIAPLALAVTLAGVLVGGPDRSSAGTAAVPTTDEARNTETLFSNLCGFCHQAGGRAAGRGPKLAGTERSDEYLLNRIRVGKEGAMPAYGRAFTEPQLKALVAYIRSLKDDGQ